MQYNDWRLTVEGRLVTHRHPKNHRKNVRGYPTIRESIFPPVGGAALEGGVVDRERGTEGLQEAGGCPNGEGILAACGYLGLLDGCSSVEETKPHLWTVTSA